jgi:hypothetical protein
VTTTLKCIVESKRAENAQTTQYTATNVRTQITKATVTNTTGGAVTYAVNLVPSGDTAAAANLILSRTIAANFTYTCPELVGQVLNAGDFISTLAGAATSLTIRFSGSETTT